MHSLSLSFDPYPLPPFLLSVLLSSDPQSVVCPVTLGQHDHEHATHDCTGLLGDLSVVLVHAASSLLPTPSHRSEAWESWGNDFLIELIV